MPRAWKIAEVEEKMKTLYLERSTGAVRDAAWVEGLDLEGVERIVVGRGPGSFAGIRSAIAFAEGYALGKKGVKVYGLPSACAIAAEVAAERLLVVGDARQGKVWLAEFEKGALKGEVTLAETLPEGEFDAVVSPDDRRIGTALAAKYGAAYRGLMNPTEKGLEKYALGHPDALVAEPLPIYLNPAVRN